MKNSCIGDLNSLTIVFKSCTTLEGINMESHILSRVMYATSTKKSHYKLKQPLFQEWATRQSHFVETKNLAYSIDKQNDKPMACFCECKAKYHSSEIFPLFKTTEQFERINVVFKGHVVTIQ